MKMINRRITFNAFWLIIDRSFILVGGLITTLIVARYLNTEQMGLINYSVVAAGFLSVFSQWGANFTLFESAARGDGKDLAYLSDTIISRILLYLTFWVFFVLYLFYSESKNDAIFISIFTLSMIFLALDVYQYVFDGRLLSKYNTVATFVGRAFSIISRLIFVLYEMNFWYFLIPLCLEGIVILFIKCVVFNKKLSKTINTSKYDQSVRKEFFAVGFPVVLFSFFSLFSDKINLILIKEFSSFSEVAVYTMAKMLSMAWTFLPLSFSTSIITQEIENMDGAHLARAIMVIILTSIPALVVTYFFSDFVISILLGAEYESSASYLFSLCLLAMFACISMTWNRIIASRHDGRRFLVRKAIVLSFFSLTFGFFIIREYHIYGAIVNVSICAFIDIFIMNYFYDHNYFKMVMKNIFFDGKAKGN